MNRIAFFLLIILSIAGTTSWAQDRPIGYWRAHMPFSGAIDAATDGVRFYVVTQESFCTYSAATNEISGYSKVEGMSDVGMSAIAYDATTDMVVLAYKNTNIDLFIDETFYNIPDIKLKLINGLKEIYDIYTEAGLAYISTSFGIVVIDLKKKEVKETYSFSANNQMIPVQCFSADATHYFAATNQGLYRALKSSINLQDFSSWQLVDARTNIVDMLYQNNHFYLAATDTVFEWRSDSLQYFFKSNHQILKINTAKNGIYVNEFLPLVYVGKIKQLQYDGTVADSFDVKGKPVGCYLPHSGDDVFIADEYFGLSRYSGGISVAEYRPNGPYGYGAFDIIATNKEVWVAHGGYDRQWRYIYNQDGFSRFHNGQWYSFNHKSNALINDAKTDFIRVAQDPVDQSVYIGSYRGGLFHYTVDGKLEDLTRTTTALEGTVGDTSAYRISGLAFDAANNLWITQYGAPHELVVKTKDGQYYNFAGAGARIAAASLIIDDMQQKWYLVPGYGVGVYNDGNTPGNPNDDSYSLVDMGRNLPSNVVYCLAKDKDGTIWIGTSDGIGIINCPSEVINGGCSVERRIVQYDIAAGYLFQGESVMAIAVDGANRKWIGTTNGVWLISASADKILYRFTTDNSPLPSNAVQKITVDPITGDVYIGTDLGLVSFRSTAIEGSEENTTIITYPNPVPSGYKGTIAIQGIAANADVRITDISGQLVYRTKALGGQAVWNGLDYTGRRPQSGVYLIFVTNSDGTQTRSGKMVFME